MATRRLSAAGRAQTGASIIETMVGILIGLLVVLVVYNILAVAEGYRRSTAGASDAQITGMLAQFVAGRDVGNGGNGITSGGSTRPNTSTAALNTCTKAENGAADNSLKPIPLLITAGATNSTSDSFVSWQSGSPHVVWPVEFHGVDSLAGQPLVVQSPNGFSTPAGVSKPTAAAGDAYWAVAIANDGTNKCKLIKIIGASVPDPVTGEVTLTQHPSFQTAITYKGTSIPPSLLLNLGPERDSMRVRYDVPTPNTLPAVAASSWYQLRTTDCMIGCTATPNPIAQNVVLLKAQYGIDTSTPLDGTVDCWTKAEGGSGCGVSDWSDLSTLPQSEIDRVIAVRLAVVVRSDEPDPTLTALGVTLNGTTYAPRPPIILFNCAANTLPGCPNRITLTTGTPPSYASPDCAPSVICDNWRYRVYETVVPLRNAIFNSTLP